VTLLGAEVKSLIAEATQEGSDQVQGLGDYRAGSSRRASQALALNKRLREIGRTARALPRAEYPGAAEQYRVPQSLRYQQLIDLGHAFLAAIGPIKSAFVERAFPRDFDEQLARQIADFDAATQRQILGRQKQREGTAGLELTMQRAKLVVAELDAIMSVLLRTSNPTQYAVWKSAVRVYKSPQAAAVESDQSNANTANINSDDTGSGNPLARATLDLTRPQLAELCDRAAKDQSEPKMVQPKETLINPESPVQRAAPAG
jgi:hypothetical protein